MNGPVGDMQFPWTSFEGGSYTVFGNGNVAYRTVRQSAAGLEVRFDLPVPPAESTGDCIGSGMACLNGGRYPVAAFLDSTSSVVVALPDVERTDQDFVSVCLSYTSAVTA